MKKLFTTVILGIALAGVALAQTSSEKKSGAVGKTDEIKLAVVEFSPGTDASGMTDTAKRQLQTALTATLSRSAKFDTVDTRLTRNESQDNLAAINGDSSAAVKLGKRLGVKYVLTGIVEEYTPKGADEFGRVVLKTRLIEVATGKVKYEGEATQRSTSKMMTEGVAEVHGKTVKPAIEKLKATLLELEL